MSQGLDFQLFDDYEQAKQCWLSRERLKHKGLKKKFGHVVAADKFIMQLQILGSASGDRRFNEALNALRDNNFVSDSNWTMQSPHDFMNGLENQYERSAVWLVDSLVQRGISKRVAFANCAARHQWPGNSFEAAVKALERLHQANGRSEVEDIS